jgi:hypothetical protein
MFNQTVELELPVALDGHIQVIALDFLLNFNHLEGPLDGRFSDATLPSDGDDRIFGDDGHDWIVGGTGRDHMYGGRGNDLINADDNHDSTISGQAPGAKPKDPLLDKLDNSIPDEWQPYADIFYGGAGRDVLILNGGQDRAIDWVGEYNSYIAPFAPFGAFHISRTLQPQLPEFLYNLSRSDGADQTGPDIKRFEDHKAQDSKLADPDPSRNYEPYGELGLVLQKDLEWQEQTGAPDDPQAGNIPGGNREVMRRELFDDGGVHPFAVDSGDWKVQGGKYHATPEALLTDAVSVYYIDEVMPGYFEVLVTANMDRPTARLKANAYIIFDYQSATDFKFAGINGSTNKLEVGHRTEAGWQSLAQGNLQMPANKDHQLKLFVNGNQVTLLVNNVASISYAFSGPLSHGMLGLGVDNAKVRFDNLRVLVLPPTITHAIDENFEDGVADYFDPVLGAWTVANSRYQSASSDLFSPAVSLMGVDLVPSAIFNMQAKLNTTGLSGFVFDYQGPQNFKFAGINTQTNQVVIGHRNASGWHYDSVVSWGLNAGQDYTLGMSLHHSTATLTLNGASILSFKYNGFIDDGAVGLFVLDGQSSIDHVKAQSLRR